MINKSLIISLFIIISSYGYESFHFDDVKGLFPNVLNLATNSIITVNATCGESGPETYCKLVEHVFRTSEHQTGKNSYDEHHCSICDATSVDKKHPIKYAIDGTHSWYQSPSLQNGKHFEWITITLDLREVYQVAYIIVKAAISPRPGNWILERSLDGIVYKPWQYFAVSDNECWETYGIRPTVGKPYYRTDDEVICTSYFSKLNPFENGEIHTSLVNGRPGADGPSLKIMEFTKARYVRLRLQKIRTLNADLMSVETDDPERSDKTVTRRYFYSIKDISIGGQCMCSGHSSSCSYDQITGKQRCKCKHHTCGEHCEQCCPLYNQKAYRPGTNVDAAFCTKCECHGHANSCYYDEKIAVEKKSIDTNGNLDGGGVCINCQHHTAGINCENCEDGYFRPFHVARNHSKPCRKCECIGPGMTGNCVKDDTFTDEGLQPGECICKIGFEGKMCNKCALGFTNYPLCEPCPCHSAGTLGSTICEGDCVCKAHVEGSRCDRCRRGFYHLSADNPNGCSECFCFGLTDECTENDWGVEVVKNVEDWFVTDLLGKRIVKPSLEGKDLVIANDDVSNLQNYFWLAPDVFLGKKLYSYGADLKFSVSYVVARGDTSGTHTEGADVIIEGNNIKLGYKFRITPGEDSLVINAPLREEDWFVIDTPGERKGPVDRESFTLAISNITRLLIRAKFHTDQIVGKLHDVGMEIASKPSKSLKKLKSIEKCFCPPGYDGLSCEICASGYRQLRPGVCEKCDCHNHAESCDAEECENCLHHTTGPKCGSCVRGYYGDPTIGTANDCKRCACPLQESENNFSPTCSATSSPSGDPDYICDQCQPGYGGNKCERCIDGYFGNPQVPGGHCQPCECSNNADTSQPGWCDTLTGQCRKCLGNTGGWDCGECLIGHFGDPTRQSCTPCLCDTYGSLSEECDLTSGQCLCKPNFIGRTCDRCIRGYGNIQLGCIACNCNSTGSRSGICDSITGHCHCKHGVFGTRCDSCLENYYGFSIDGCNECKCDIHGSFGLQCDEKSGKCGCKPNIKGRTCDRCEDGYWNLQSGNGCEKCHCNRTGSAASLCDKNTGQCTCKEGVGGIYCDQCLPGYYKFGRNGCRKCDPCDAPGHICDPETGRCVCPPFTTGRKCQKCVSNAWGYDPLSGCKPCNCNLKGSSNNKCDPVDGNCICMEGFEGRHCDQCRHGFYNFPNCYKCDCNMAGTDKNRCNLKDQICHCNEAGKCFCKEHVLGEKCDKCKEDAFGLKEDNRKGCHNCFCFHRTRLCSQANMFWSKLTFPQQEIFTEIGASDIPSHLGYQVIPQNIHGRRLGIPYVLQKPLYYSLPKEKLGDKVLSYNGYLTFNVESHSKSHFPDQLLKKYPLVVLQGNQRLVLFHPHSAIESRRPYKLKLHEDHWINMDNPQYPVKKSLLMVTLQNLQTILIRATDGPDVKYSVLYNVTLDEAVPDYGDVLAEGIEICRCPRQYVGSSCQDPAPGYYRKRKPNFLDSKDVLDLVGSSEPCACNNHTNECDKETGICINCGGNTVGDYCENCAKGYYGNPEQGPCRPCSCPQPTNSFSDTCMPDSVDYICVNCRTGYSGRHCEKCDKGYYGNPLSGKCTECRCNRYGSKSAECDNITGECTCKDGITGRDCTLCSHGYILTEYGCKSCEDECTGVLLNELYQMKLMLEGMNLTDLPKLPWGYLKKINVAQEQLRPMVDDYKKKVDFGKELLNNFTFYFDLETEVENLFVRASKFIDRATSVSSQGKKTLDDAEKLFLELNKIWRFIKDLALELDKQVVDPSGPGFSTERMLKEAERILLEIQNRIFFPAKENAERELRKALHLLEKIKTLTRSRGHQIDELKKRIDHLDASLRELVEKITEDVHKPSEKAKETIRRGKLRLDEVKGTVGQIIGGIDGSNKTLIEAANLLGNARAFVIDAAVKFEYLPRLLRDVENATESLDKHRSILAFLNPLYRIKYVIPAQEHADDLDRQSKELGNLFSATRELSEFPLQAAKAYQNIIDAINDAENAAKQAETAAENAFKKAYPGTDDALTAQATKAKVRSLELLQEAQRLNEEDVPELEIALRQRKSDLNNLSQDIFNTRKSDLIINREIDLLPKGIKIILENANSKGKAAERKVYSANNKISNIDELLKNDLKPRYENIHAGSEGSLENLNKMIQQARDDIKGASNLANSAQASANRVRKQHASLVLDLKDLKNKVLLARQKASSIRVALTTDEKNECRRSYKPVVEPSTTNNIIINYAINSAARDSLLFYLGNSNEEDFLAVEMVNRKIRFLWNAGGGTQIIQHNLTIETNNEQLLKNEKWFKIEANRIGNLGTLTVKRTPDGHKSDPHEVSGSSVPGFTKMNVDQFSNLFVGGFPENYLYPNELRTSSFAGCLYELLLDGKSVGLWNFLTSHGCSGCKEGATEDIDVSSFEFQGKDSYAIIPQNPYYRKSDMYTVMNFKTLNEDGLLFLSSNSKTGDLISLELNKGKVLYQLRFNGGRSRIFIETKKKYNNGKWTRVEAAREKFEAQILVQDEFLQETHSKEGSASLDLTDSPLYYGGVPPNFTTEGLQGINFKSFFGCFKDLQMDSTAIALSRGSFFGMRVGCSNKPLRVSSFIGDGFIELDGEPLAADSSFSFSFLTHQQDSLLMICIFTGKKDMNYISLALKDARIEARLNSESSGEMSMVSDRTLSTAVYHNIAIIRKNRRLLLRVDDEEEAEIRLPRGVKDMLALRKGGLFFGGVKKEITLKQNMAASILPFAGVIQDVIINERLIAFENAVDFTGVDFGLPDIIKPQAEQLFKEMGVPEIEEKCEQLTKDSTMFMYSISKKDYSRIKIEKREITREFNITFQFKAEYENGLLLFAKNGEKRQFLEISLENTSLIVEFKRKNQLKTITSQLLDIKNWHMVELLKIGSKLTLYVDKILVSSIRVPKKLIFKEPLYLGRSPKNISRPIFHGCFRGLFLNGVLRVPSPYDHCSNGLESYFLSGKSVLLDSNFKVDDTLTMSFEFHAHEDGTIFYIHSRDNIFSFEVEVFDHRKMILVTLYLKNKKKIELSEKLRSSYMCNDIWHKAKISYTNGKLSLELEDTKPIHKPIVHAVQQDHMQIYIGGKPSEHHQDFDSNFIGCLRNIVINELFIDLRKSEDSHTFHSCTTS